jgi:hypothetical protein
MRRFKRRSIDQMQKQYLRMVDCRFDRQGYRSANGIG